ncbi:MAG: hypothetical protein AB8B73_02930 [Ekhidna sp.]
MNSKPRVLKTWDKLDLEIQEQIKLQYQEGFEDNLINVLNKDGEDQTVLPLETEDKYYLVKMTYLEAYELIEEDDDYDEHGRLFDGVRQDFEAKYDED